MTTKFEIVKGTREYTYGLRHDTDYWVSGSGTFTVEVLQTGKLEPVFAVILREGFIQLPRFAVDTQIRLIGRDTMSFTIFLSDARTF